jgi:hypothetical protein
MSFRFNSMPSLIVAIALSSTAAHLSFAGAGSGGGGAGCPQSDGSVITLLECGARQDPDPNPTFDPPPGPSAIDAPSQTPDGLAELQNYIKNYPYLDDAQKKVMLDAFQPTFYRKYFFVDNAPDLTYSIVERIKGEFQRATGLDRSQLILYGVTDTSAHISNSDQPVQITYLLPAFRQLKTMEEKMTALYHENYWVVHPSATYLEVVNAEMAFEAAMQKPGDAQKQIDYIRGFTQWSPALQKLFLQKDFETGALKGFANDKNEITNIELFGSDVISCFNGLDGTGSYGSNWNACQTEFLDHRDSLLRSFPNSLFLASIRSIGQSMDTRAPNLFIQMMNALYGGRVLDNGYEDLHGVKPIFSDLFTWDTEIDFDDGDPLKVVGALFGYKNVNWGFSGVSNKTVTLTLTTDVNSSGPFVTEKFAQPNPNYYY